MIFAVNRNTEEPVEFTADLRGFADLKVLDFEALESDDMKVVNSAESEPVKPVKRTDAKMDGGMLTAVLKPSSFVTIVLGK